MTFTNTHCKIAIVILVVIAGISLTFNLLCFQQNLPETLVNYESLERVGDQKTALKLQFPSSWNIQSARTNVVLSSSDQQAQFFLPMSPLDLEGLTPLSTEQIKIGDQTYTQNTYGAGNLKAVFIEDFSYGTSRGIGYKYQDEIYKAQLDKILTSHQNFSPQNL